MTEPVTTSILIGLAISAATAAASYMLNPPPPDQEGPRRDDLARTTSAYGKFRTISYGTGPNAGNIIDSSKVYETANEEEVGGKGGKSSTLTTFTYQQDIALGLGEGVIDAIASITANEELIYDVNGTVVKPEWLEFKFYPGSETQQPDPTLQAIHGAENTPAYLGEAYIVFTKFNLSAFGNRIPNFRVVTVTDAESEAIETEVLCNPDFSTTTDALLTVAAMHPTTGYMVHGWDWGSLATGRENPIGTVTDPYSVRTLFSLNKPAPVGQLNAIYPSFGTLPNYEFGIQTNGDYENILLAGVDGSNVAYFVYSAYSDVLDASGVMNQRFQESASYDIGSVLSDNFVIYGTYTHDDGGGTDLYDLVYWPIGSGGVLGGVDSNVAISDISSVVPGFNAFNMLLQTNQKGDVLIYSEYGGDNNIIKYTHLEAVKWVIQVPPELVAGARAVVINAVYDEVNNYWWTAYDGYIWNFRNDTGATIGAVIDISADPDYVAMYTKPSFSINTRKLYWVAHSAPGDVAGSYDTVTGEVLNYPVGSYESANGLNTAENAYYFYPTNALFYSSQSATRINPSRRFRLQSLIGNAIPLSTIVNDIFDRCGIPLVNYNNTDLDATPVDGFTITNLTTGRSNAAPLQHGYLFDVVDSGGVLKSVLKGKDSVAQLTQDDIGATTDIDNPPVPINVNRVMESQLPAIANVGYMNPDANYEHGSQQSTRGASTNTNVLNIELPIVFKDTPAKRLIDVILHQLHIERENYELSIMPAWIWLEAGDVIDVTDGIDTYNMQLVKTAFVDGVMECEAVRVEQSILTSYLEGESAPVKDDVVAFPGIMLTGLLDIPLLRDTDDNAGFYAAATSYTYPWAGGVLFKSPDNSAWNVGSTFTSASVYGSTNDALPAPVDPWQWDNLNTITVQVISGELHSVTDEQALKGFNSFAYGRDGRWEVGNYVNADPDPVIENVYHLSRLIRGRLGTDHNVGNHQANDLFIPLKISNLEYVGNELADLNVVRYYRGASFNVNLYTPSNIITPFVNHGVCITPLSPQQIAGTRNSALDLMITWMPRSRYPASDFWSGVASESDDLYDIEIYLDGETVPIHTVTDNVGRSYTWLRADQISEADGTPQPVDISVWHKSQRLLSIGETGRGYEGTGRAVIGIQGEVPYYSAVGFLTSTVVHFKVNESPITDGLPAAEETGSITDAFYNLVGSIASTASVFPSNIQSDPADKSFHCEENNFGDRLDIPVISNNVFNVGNKFSVSFGARIRGVKTSSNFIARAGQFTISVVNATDQIQFSVSGPEGIQYTNTDAAIDIRDDLNHHWVFTVDIDVTHNILEIHRDGVLVSIGNQGTTITSVEQPTSTTCYIAPELIWFDDFAYHNDVLSASAIAYLYSNTGL